MADVDGAPPGEPGLPGPGQENQDPTDKGSLRKMFAEGIAEIETHRSENLFQALEQRSLTDEEQRVIEQRVALQRKMLAEYEKREMRRKVQELMEVCPDITEVEAERALELCDNREDDAAAALVSDAAFRRRVKDAVVHGTATTAPKRENSFRSRPSRTAGPRPKLIDPATLGGSVFVGAFRGKGFNGNSSRPAAKGKAAAKLAVQCDDSEPSDEGPEGSDGTVEQEDAADDKAASATQPKSKRGASKKAGQPASESAEQPAQEASPPASAGAGDLEGQHASPSGQAASDVADAAAGASGRTPRSAPKMYALVKQTESGTIREATDSDLKAAKRELGVPTDSDLTVNKALQLQGTPHTEGGKKTDAGAAVISTPALQSMATRLASLDHIKAIAWLEKMERAVAAGVLQLLADTHPELVASLREHLEAEQVAGDRPQAESAPASGRPGRRSAQRARPAARKSQQSNSDDSLSFDDAISDSSESESNADESDSSGSDYAPKERPSRAATKQSAPARPARAGRAAKNAALAAFAAASDDERGDAVAVDEPVCEPEPVAERKPAAKPKAAAKPKSAGKAQPASKKRKTSAAKPQPPADDVAPSSAEQTTADEGTEPAGQEAPAQPAVAAGNYAATAGETADPGQECGEQGTSAAALQPSSAPAEAPATKRGGRAAGGHVNRGRIKQKSHKTAELVELGTLCAKPGWYNTGYIFPNGFKSRTLFRSSVAIDQLCVHECLIIGEGGEYWPAPTYKVVALDRPDEPLVAKSCTGCWTAILKRINAEIEARRRTGEDLPPPPKTAIAGPEYFGLNQANIAEAIEALDPEHLCTSYWAGKEDRGRLAAGLPTQGVPRAPRAPSNGASRASRRGGGGRGRKRPADDSESEEQDMGEDDETAYMSNRWSAVSRTERYRKRLEENGEDVSHMDADNPLPNLIDPITLEPVVRPAISPYGHVMGMATWKAVLAETQQCPFTKQLLQWEQCKVLTKNNIHLYKDRIIR